VAERGGLSTEEFAKTLSDVREKLLASREQRVRPLRDDKVLTDWNGLMIAALARGGRVLDEPGYGEAAAGAAGVVLTRMRDDEGRLFHRYREGESAIPGLLDDYAFFTWGLLELYEATFDVSYLREALDLTDLLLTHFRDPEGGAFYLSPDYGETLLVRAKEAHDGAVPSGNSVAMMNLLRLGRMTGRAELEEHAAGVATAFSGLVARSASAFTALLAAVAFAEGPSHEIVVVGEQGTPDTDAMLSAIGRKFLPNGVVLFRQAGREGDELSDLAPFVRDLRSIDGKATAYVCRGRRCDLPTTDVGEMLRLLERG
jgi:uncharacterized protein YyaL (SSP411 family)